MVAVAIVAICAGAAALTPHHWLPPAVDALRWVVGFGLVSRLERFVFESLDHTTSDVPISGDALAWEAVSRCAPPGFERARKQVDPARPDVETTFVRMDTEALRLRLHRGGAPPTDSVAAFNGAFQIDHGRFGLRTGGVSHVTPRQGAGTLGVDADGRVKLWTWTSEDAEDQWVDLRQNLQLLLDTTRTPAVLEKMTLVADGRTEQIGLAPTRRSGVCLDGHWLVYVWSRRATAATLGRAMEEAGCTRGLHLDSNAFHTRFEFLDGCVELAAPEMTDGPRGRFRSPQSRDFFTVARPQADP